MAATIVGPYENISAGLAGGNSSAYNITAAQVVKATRGVCVKISCITAGSLTLNDCAVLGNAAISNEFFSGSLTAGQVIELNWPCGTGITVSALTTFVGAMAFA
jgi:hypothetical protein